MIQKWKEMSSKRQRSIVLGGLGAIILLMAIGYAAFSTQLQINGTSNITSNWNVRITNITSILNGGATNAVEPTYDNENGLTASFSTNLTSPGDNAEYTIEVSNLGDIDATLTNIEINDSNNPAIIFETSGLSEGDNLLQGAKDELIVKVSYNENVTSQPENTTSNITVTLTYEQASGGSIPEEPKNAVEIITDLVSLSPVELYTDEHNDIRYYGANPNNYISFNNELWRIIGVIDGKLKIVRNESIGNYAWSSGYDDYAWNSSDLKNYLNGEYYDSINDVYQNMISNEEYYLKSPSVAINDYTASEYYNFERGGFASEQYIGLMYPSDYGYAAGTSCLTTPLNVYNSNCKDIDYLHKGVSQWLLLDGTSYITASYLKSDGMVEGVDYDDGGVFNLYAVFPALYLKSDITLTGEGTNSNPFVIESI